MRHCNSILIQLQYNKNSNKYVSLFYSNWRKEIRINECIRKNTWVYILHELDVVSKIDAWILIII